MPSPGIVDTWRALATPGLTAACVAELVHHAGTALLDVIESNYDESYVVLRGGLLLQSCLVARGYRPLHIEGGRGRIPEVPISPPGAKKLLLCDVLSDTGETLLRCLQAIRDKMPKAEVHIICPFVTQHALDRLTVACQGVHTLEVLGRGAHPFAATPRDIPYDFGDVAAQCFPRLHGRLAQSPRRLLLASWASVLHGGPTVGDLMALEAVRRLTADCGITADIACECGEVSDSHEVEWRCADPSLYKSLIFVCGPIIAGSQSLRQLFGRFEGCQKIGVGVSILPKTSPDHWNPFDLVLARDGLPETYGDVAISWTRPPRGSQAERVIGICLRGPQCEYGKGMSMHVEAERIIDAVGVALGYPLVRLETRMSPSSLDVYSIYRAFSIPRLVITTRLHGALFALSNGVPVLALDQVRGGGKLSAVLRRLGWEDTFHVDSVNCEKLIDRGRFLLAGTTPHLVHRARMAAIAESRRTLAALRGILLDKVGAQGA